MYREPSSRRGPLHSRFVQACLQVLFFALAALFSGSALAQLPAGWSDADIGSPGLAGSANFSGGTWTVAGGGSDIWGAADQFNLACQTTTNNVIVAQVGSIQNTDGWAKSGVMFRDSLDPASVFAMVVITPTNGVSFQWRNTHGGQCAYVQVSGVYAPIRVKLVRQNNIFRGYYGTDGVNWTPIGGSQTIEMTSDHLAGLCVTAHNNSALNTSIFSEVSLSYLAPTPPPPPPTFGVYRELWTEIYGGLDVLTNPAVNPDWPDNPNSAYTTCYTNFFETDINTGMNNYGQRLRAFLIPPTNGNYVFWISSDDNSELFLSSDETPAHKVRIASVSSWASSREWSKFPEQQSAAVPLEAGGRYYIEAVMQQGTGGDNLAVRWQLPDYTFEEPVPAISGRGTRLIPCTGVDSQPGIYQQTTNVTVVERQDLSMSVLVTNQSAVTYQWRLNGTNLLDSGANKPFYVISNASIAVHNGRVYTCAITNSAGGTISAGIIVTVLPDTVPPTVVRAVNVGTNAVQIVYSEPVEAASATNLGNYHFTNGLGIATATLGADGASVMLGTGALTYGSNYCVLISNVRDRASTPNVIAPNTPATFTAVPYTSQDVGNPAVGTVVGYTTNGVNVTAAGSDIGGANDQFSLNYTVRTGDFDVCTRLAGLSLSDVWAKAGLMARETLDQGARFTAILTTPSMVGSFFEWRDPAYSVASTSGRFPGNYPNTWLRLRRIGNSFSGFASYDGTNWVQLGSVDLNLSAQLYVGMVVSSHSSGQTTVAQFRDISDVGGGVIGTLTNPQEPLGPCSRRTALVISEIMYKPAHRSDTNNLEFLEIYNSNPYFEDISGFQITGGSISYVFPPGTILPGGAFLVVAASPASMSNVYGITNVMGPYTGSLKKAGTIQLLDEQGAILLTVPYANESPWPMGADGTGHSIVLANPTYGEGNARAWEVSDTVGGSPGQMEGYHPSPLRNVVINELLAHTDPPDYDYVELYNHANSPVDVSGCIITDNPDTNMFVIPQGTVIPARGFVWYSETNLYGATNMGFRLSSFGETILLKSPDQSRVLDAIKFGGMENGVSMGRWPDGAGEWYRLAAKTPGTNNGSIRSSDVVINELMYHPISGDNDDQYVELFNRSAHSVDLGMWRLGQDVSFTFPSNTVVASGGHLVVARNAERLRTNYSNLNAANCLGDFSGKLSHKGARLTLEMPHYDWVTNGTQVATAITMHIVVNEVTYTGGGRWGQWSDGGGSSLELTDPNSNNRLAANWADSDETSKSVWTNLEFTGVLDNGANYNGAAVDRVQVGLLDVGECLVDNIEVRPGGPGGANAVSGGDFEAGLGSWIMQGDHIRSGIETAGGLGGYQSSQSLHLRASDSFWTMGNYAQGELTDTSLASGQTATLRLKGRWLHGAPEVLLRLRGNWLELAGTLSVPANLGTPGQRNSRYVTNAGPAIYAVKHSPALPVADQAVIVEARFHDPSAVVPTLQCRIDAGWDPAPSYVSVAMKDDGTGGDAIAGDGLYSATIPGQPTGAVAAFVVQAQDALGATTVFPADKQDNAGVPRECVVAFGDPIPTGSFSHHHVFITANWAQLWAQNGGVSHESYDGTWVDGGGRVVYNWSGRYAGSPYHQYTGSPVTTLGGMHWAMPGDEPVLGVTSLNKQHVPGNGPLDDNTMQREQTAWWMAHKIGLPRENRRYYVFYVNGNRHGPLMEDTQVPGGDMIDEYWPNDNEGWLFKNHAWFEGEVAQSTNGSMGFNNMSWCTIEKYTTTINGVPDQYKLARYRWMWNIRQYPNSANDYSQVFALIDAANTPTTSPAYYANMEAQVDTEQWLRMSAIEHAVGNWDSIFAQNQWNMYNYKPRLGKWTALKWDWNISLGSSSWAPDGSQLFNFGPGDSAMARFQNYPAYFRAYLRALQDIANVAMNNAMVDPGLDTRYAAFVANGLTANSAYGLMVQDPGAAGLKNWIGTMHNSINAALANQGVDNVAFAVNATTVSNGVAIVSGTAPIAVKTIWFNGAAYPVTWNSVTGWTAVVPLHPGTNQVSVVGTDLHNQAVPGASNSIALVYGGTLPSPANQVVINEIMCDPAVPGGEYVELYNNSTNMTFDLSGWRLNGLDYTFPPGALLNPGGYLVLVSEPAAFAQAYGGLTPYFGVFAGKLQNDGEMLSLITPGTNGTDGLVVSRVRYGSALPWPQAGANTSSSLQLVDSRQDHWRVGNWGVMTSNTLAVPQWVFVSTNIPATSSTLHLYLASVGDIYLDDLQLVGGAGTNVVANGSFESPLTGSWNLTANFTNSSLSTVVKRSGNSSLHLVAAAGGTGGGNSVYQTISPALNIGQNYTLSFWYLQTTNGGPLIVRLSSSSNPATVNPAPAVVGMNLAAATPGAANSVAGALATFPPLGINEVQPENLTGPTNSAGQHTAWLELYNPSTNTVPLNGIYLANTGTNLTQWAFPATAVISPGEFKVVFADGQTNLSTATELHASFSLAAGTGSLALTRVTTNAQQQVLDFIDYASLAADFSFGSLPDGQAFYRQRFARVTPGGTNDGTVLPSFIGYTQSGSVYAQDFNTLPAPTNSVNADNPVTIEGTVYALPDPFDFALAPVTAGTNGGLGLAEMAGWYGWGALGAKFGATYGDQTTGGVISFGQPGNTNRALGLLATSSTGATAFGARFVNQTTQTLDSITVQLTGAVWRQSDRAKTNACYYLVDVSGAQRFPTNFTAVLAPLNVAFAAVPGAVGGMPVDGTALPNQVSLSVTNQTITNWPPGAVLWLVWQMTDPAGKAQGLAIDEFRFSAGKSNQPPVLAPISDRSVHAGMLLNFAVSASDPDGDPLVFGLGAGAPAGASVDQSGVFNWRPTQQQAPGTNTITLTVADSGVPSLSASRSFTVTVIPPPRLGSVALLGHSLTFSLPTLNSQQYQIEYTPELESNLWNPLGSPVTGTGVPLVITNDITGDAQRFYRVRLVQ